MVHDNLPIPDRYSRVGRYQSAFVTGSLPSWLTTNTSNGGTVTAESANGGQIRCETGTNSGDSVADVIFDANFNPTEYAAISITTEIAGDLKGKDSFNQGTANTFLNTDNAGTYLVYNRISDNVSTEQGDLNTPNKDYSRTTIRESLIVDNERNVVQVVTGGLSTNPIADSADDVVYDRNKIMRLVGKETDNLIMEIRSVDISFWMDN